MEFILKIKIGKNGAKDYFALKNALQSVEHEIRSIYEPRIVSRFPMPKFRQTARDVRCHEIYELPRVIGKWTIAPDEVKLSERLLAIFPWLTDGNETLISRADAIDNLQQLFHSLIAEGR